MDILRELGEPSKRQILAQLRSGPKSVSDLVEATGMKQPNVSNHLARLRARDLVRSEKVGRQVFYVLASPELADLLSALDREELTVAEPLALDEALVLRFAKATTQGDETESTKIVDQLLRQNTQPVDIYGRLLTKALVMIGQWWQVQAIDISQEHTASALIERLMARVVHHANPAKSVNITALLGCVEGNWHALGLRMVSDILKLSGWNVVYMGANVPHNSFLTAIEDHRPQIVMVGCSTEDHEEASIELLKRLQDHRQNRPGYLFGIGGAYASMHPDRFQDYGADFVGQDLDHLTNQLVPELEQRVLRRFDPHRN